MAPALLAAASLLLAADPVAEPGLATPPQLKQLVPPQLPPGTAFPAPEVTVILGIDVSATGAVEEVRVEEGAGEPFDSAAVAAARQFRFEPARLATGEAVPVTITFRMRITPPPPPPPPAPPPVRFSGRLLERGTRRPLAGVPVAAQAGTDVLARATTDADGRFSLEVPAAAFDVVAFSPGHARLQARVEAKPGEEREETVYLEPVPSGYSAVVRGERVRREITKQVIPADEVAIVAGTQGDTLKAVLNLPGAARVPFGGGALVLRGSAPGDSAAFVEGLQIPVLYHFGGLRSTFAPRFLDSVEFVPGNFSADYGRLIGGIVNARVRDPSSDLFRGEADFNLYDAGVAAEGPLAQGWSVGGAFRRSWVDAVLPLFLPKDAPLTFQTAPRFYDYQFLSTWKPPGGRDELRLLFFGSQDKVVGLLSKPSGDPTISGEFQGRIAFHELQLDWRRVLSPALREDTWIALGLQSFDTSVGPSLYFNLASKRVDARSTRTWQALRAVEARAGLDFQYSAYDVALDVPQVRKEGEPPTPVSTRPRVAAVTAGDLVEPAAFAEVRLAPVESLSILPALRVDWNNAIGRWSVDPRLMVRWRAAPRTVLKAAAGVYHQPPQPDESSPQIGTPDLHFERSLQYSAGVEQEILDGLSLDAVGFYKDISQLVVRNQAAAVDPRAPAYTNEGTGRIYGLEMLLRARFGDRFFGWIAYTFQRSFRTDRPGSPERLFDFDQPHLLTVLGTWRPTAGWAFGARYRLVSGNPYTPIVRSIYDAATDVYVPVYGAVNSGRLSSFQALDVRVDKLWTFDRWRLSLYLDVQNVFNRANQEGWQYSYDYRLRQPLTGLPILPILGVKGEW